MSGGFRHKHAVRQSYGLYRRRQAHRPSLPCYCPASFGQLLAWDNCRSFTINRVRNCGFKSRVLIMSARSGWITICVLEIAYTEFPLKLIVEQ